MPPGAVQVHRGSATALPLSDRSVDYIATDPPFGAHIVYSDASLLWEGWLDDFTDRTDEAIVVAGGDQPKKVSDYEDLLRGAFAEMHRVLKPHASGHGRLPGDGPARSGGRSSARPRDAGFDLRDATTLDKGQPSFKQIKGQNGERVAADRRRAHLRPPQRSAVPRLRPVLTPVQAARGRAAADRGSGDACPSASSTPSVNARLFAAGGRTGCRL